VVGGVSGIVNRQQFRIAIIGGGIGGLTVALALKEFGFEAEVYEQAPVLLDVGAAIALWPNAMRVLERLGLGTMIREHAGEMREIRWLDQRGFLINRVSISGAVALHRADLQSTLLHALPAEWIKLGHSLVAYDSRGDKVVARFRNGEEIEADLLIGADGIHSHVRRDVIGSDEPTYRGYTVWRGITSEAPHGVHPNTAIEVHGRGQRFGIGPVGNGRIGWWAAANAAEAAGSHERHVEDAQHELLRLFRDWFPPLVELIETTLPQLILTTSAFDRQPARTWGNKRVTLLGDAIHPTTPNLGQGGCLAIEDAIVLARCFEKYGPTEAALRKYEGCRYSRTAAITKYSRYYGHIGQSENILVRGLKASALALAPETVLQRVMQIVFDYDATTTPI
jgi:2-polyprenyl-6-methoxyphenol hydroxylase-like FAD-dependent oxidoreductase